MQTYHKAPVKVRRGEGGMEEDVD